MILADIGLAETHLVAQHVMLGRFEVPRERLGGKSQMRMDLAECPVRVGAKVLVVDTQRTFELGQDAHKFVLLAKPRPPRKLDIPSLVLDVRIDHAAKVAEQLDGVKLDRLDPI